MHVEALKARNENAFQLSIISPSSVFSDLYPLLFVIARTCRSKLGSAGPGAEGPTPDRA